jgi:O-antigen biosynthesis protein
MKLSVIIVNYNVRYFLEQCLISVFRAAKGIEMEVIVVDNNSVDGSVEMLRAKFPALTIIENHENTGFSKANNQGIAIARGEYLLLLNPDTVVGEDCFRSTLAFMDAHPDAGGLGVKMVDGKGRFLPESKRSLPTPFVAFSKIFGLSALFPKSKVFGRYHLGFLDREKVHKVEVLSGAFMMIRAETLRKTGGLDESFFMYGEDIDMSYRITCEGYSNYYFPGTSIIHYKGESTKKSSVNYVFVFYKAMVIFARKHFSRKNARLFSFLIHLAIYLRAGMALFFRVFRKLFLPVADAMLIFGGLYIIKELWEKQVLMPRDSQFPPELLSIVVPLYILMWLTSVLFAGGYDKPVKLSRIFTGIIAGTIIILMIYALLSEAQRFSRAIILLGASWALISMTLIRILLYLAGFASYRPGSPKNRRYAIVGDPEEAGRVAAMIQKSELEPGFIGMVHPTGDGSHAEGFIGNISQLTEIVEIYNINEVIFCSRNLPPQDIIDQMSLLQKLGPEFKIAPPESLYIIGSNSINTSGDLYVLNLNSIARPHNKRNKLLFDYAVSFILLAALPVMLIVVRKPFRFLRNLFLVLSGIRTWVGYSGHQPDEHHRLPRIRKGVISTADTLRVKNPGPDLAYSLDLLYAKDYRLVNDMKAILRGIRKLGDR